MNIKIPKIIHQIFFPFYFDKIPKQWEENIKIWKQMHPEYVYILWDFEKSLNFLKKFYPWFVETWLNYRHNIQKCDAIRYFILYHFGGVYSDLDQIPNMPIDPLLYYDVFLPENGLGGISNSLLGAIKGHQFFKKLIENLIKNKDKFWYLGKHINVMCSTGPRYVENMYKEYIIENPTDIFVICSKSFYGKCDVCSTEILTQDNQKNNKCAGYLFTQTGGKSWNKFDTKILNHLYCNWKNYIILFLVILTGILLYLRYGKKCGIVCEK